jgi:long-chain acyl-CoA synthetase
VNLSEMLAKAAASHPQSTAIVYGERRLSFTELDTAANRFADALLEMGITKGDRVAMLLTNTPEHVIIFFAIASIGAISVPLDVKLKYPEIVSLFRHAEPKALIAESGYLETIADGLEQFEFLEHVIAVGKYSGDVFTSYEAALARGRADAPKIALSPDDIVQISYTSGPAFHPHGVMLDHNCFVKEADSAARWFHFSRDDVVALFALPLHHVFGMTVLLLAAFSRGATVVMQPGLSLTSLWEAVERERVTVFMGVPYVYILANALAAKDGLSHDISSLRLCISSGAALPMKVLEDFRQFFGGELRQLWGLTEATAHVTCQQIDGGDGDGSVGHAMKGWKVRVLEDNENVWNKSETGEIIVRGPMMRGYYRDPEGTATVIKDGWLHTGDIGRLDDNGELYITGRKRDMIIVKGQNVYPSDIEKVLSGYPNVAEAAAYGESDELRGEQVRAVVTLKNASRVNEKEMREWCRRSLANYKIPKQIKVIGFMPRDSDGNIVKDAIRNI